MSTDVSTRILHRLQAALRAVGVEVFNPVPGWGYGELDIRNGTASANKIRLDSDGSVLVYDFREGTPDARVLHLVTTVQGRGKFEKAAEALRGFLSATPLPLSPHKERGGRFAKRGALTAHPRVEEKWVLAHHPKLEDGPVFMVHPSEGYIKREDGKDVHIRGGNRLSLASTKHDVRTGELVLYTFRGAPPEGGLVKYLDGNVENIKLDNLAWKVPTSRRKNHSSEMVLRIICLCGEGNSRKEVMTLLELDHTTVRRAVEGIVDDAGVERPYHEELEPKRLLMLQRRGELGMPDDKSMARVRRRLLPG